MDRILVLVVDDYADATELLAEALRVSGYDVLSANDGLSAIDLAREHPPSAAFIDIGMPDPDGYEVARRLRALPNGRELFLVALTGHGRDMDRHRSQEAGFDLHVVKPVDLGVVASLLAARFPD